MKLLNRYNKTITFSVDKPKEAVCNHLVNVAKINSTNADNIKIKIKPSFFNPFAGRGYINLNLSESKNGIKTVIECEIVPTSITERGIYLITFFLSLWTIVGLLISQNFYSLLTVVFGWIILIGFIHLTQMLNQSKLETYIRFIISTIDPMTQKKAEPTI